MPVATLNDNQTDEGGSMLQSKLPYGGGRLLSRPVITIQNEAPSDTPKQEALESNEIVDASTGVAEITSDLTSPVIEKSLKNEGATEAKKDEALSDPIVPLLPKMEREKKLRGMKVSMTALTILGSLKESAEKERGALITQSLGTRKILLQNADNIILQTLGEAERTVFSLAFLMACISRSGTTIIETGLILSRTERAASVPFITEKIGFKKNAWENATRRKMESGPASALALAPLISMEVLLSLVDGKGIRAKSGVDKITAKDEQGHQEYEVVSEQKNLGVVAVGEDINTIVRDEITKQDPGISPLELRDSKSFFNKKIKWAIEEIQKDVRAYGIAGSITMLAHGSSVNREAIAQLVKRAPSFTILPLSQKAKPYTKENVGSGRVAEELNTLNILSGGVMATGRADVVEKAETRMSDEPSAVNDAHGDEVTTIFLDDNFVKIIKLICKVNDTTSLELTFKKYASSTVKQFTDKLKGEDPLIAAEMSMFLTWAKNSYLKDRAALFESLTLVYILTVIEKGISGTTNSK